MQPVQHAKGQPDEELELERRSRVCLGDKFEALMIAVETKDTSARYFADRFMEQGRITP